MVPGATGIDGLSQLSGGASQETWSFDVVHPLGNIAVILRRAPAGSGAAPGRAAGLEAEAVLMQQAFEVGIPSPRVRYVLRPQDGLGSGFIMDRVEGRTIPRKILRDAQFAQARAAITGQLGKTIAGIHALDKSRLPNLRLMTVAGEIDDLAAEVQVVRLAPAGVDLALRWLRDNAPAQSDIVTLVHGDFRHGNLIVGPEGLRAVLDWELAHVR